MAPFLGGAYLDLMGAFEVGCGRANVLDHNECHSPVFR